MDMSTVFRLTGNMRSCICCLQTYFKCPKVTDHWLVYAVQQHMASQQPPALVLESGSSLQAAAAADLEGTVTGQPRSPTTDSCSS